MTPRPRAGCCIPIAGNQSNRPILRLLIFLSVLLGLVATTTAWADIEIDRASWSSSNKTLTVRGDEAPDNGTVTIRYGQKEDNGAVIGTTQADNDGEWTFFSASNLNPAPCDVTGDDGDDDDDREVGNAPNDCSNDGGVVEPPPGEVGDVSINSTSQNRASVPTTAVIEEPVPNPNNSQNPATDTGTQGFQIVAINDLGMHCGDLDTRISSILPLFNVLHAQVIRKGGDPDLLTRADAVEVFYTAASNPNDPVLTSNPLLSVATDGSLYKTNFWDVARTAYDPFYPAGVLPLFYPDSLPVGFESILDLGLPVPNVEVLYITNPGTLVATQQSMPSENSRAPDEGAPLNARTTDPYVANERQLFQEFIGDLPFFNTPAFQFGYIAEDVNWFEAAGIPISFADDFGRENAYPLMRVQAVAEQGNNLGLTAGTVLASVDTVVPISAEADCQACHADPTDPSLICDPDVQVCGSGLGINRLEAADIDPVLSENDSQFGTVPALISLEWASDKNLLKLHDIKWGTSLISGTTQDFPTPGGTPFEPVVCQTCHYTPALDLAQVGPNNENGREQTNHETMSRVMHFVHGSYTQPDGDRPPIFPDMPPINQRVANNIDPEPILNETCYMCHPGQRTKCLRGAMAQAGIVCQDCHGQMVQVGNDFSRDVAITNRASFPDEPVLVQVNDGGFILANDFYTNPNTPRVPWANEAGCGSCHTGDVLSNLAGESDVVPASVLNPGDTIRLAQVYRVGDPKATPIVPTNKRFAEDPVTAGTAVGTGNPMLYRVSNGGIDLTTGPGESGHGGLFCEACHGSTHAEWPLTNPPGSVANDNVTANQLQGHVGTIIECSTCHDNAMNGEDGITLDGPHGMHPVGGENVDFVDGGHEDLVDDEDNPVNCQVCHGPGGIDDNVGSVLSVAKDDRDFRDLEDGGQVTKGTPIGCTTCHD